MHVLAWLSVWSEVLTCIWPSWCHCHSLSLASIKSRSVLPFWYRLTRVVPDKGPLNGMRVCVWCVCAYDTIRGYILTCAQKLSAHFILLITLSLNERQRLFNNCDHKIEWLDIRINVTKSRCVCFGPLRYLYSNNHLWWSDICFG